MPLFDRMVAKTINGVQVVHYLNIQIHTQFILKALAKHLRHSF